MNKEQKSARIFFSIWLAALVANIAAVAAPGAINIMWGINLFCAVLSCAGMWYNWREWHN